MHAYPRGVAGPPSAVVGPPGEMCRTKSVGGGHAGPSDGAPVCRASTFATAFSLRHDTSRNPAPRELQSFGPRNSTPYPEGAALPGDPPAGVPWALPGDRRQAVGPSTATRARRAGRRVREIPAARRSSMDDDPPYAHEGVHPA
jgi:hypothetical protein